MAYVSDYNNNYSSYRSRDKFAPLNTKSDPVYPKPEVKFKDTLVGTVAAPEPVSSDGLFTSLNDLSQGTSGSTRIGQQVATRSIYYQWVLNLGSTPVPSPIRFVLVWDRQSNASPTLAQLFSDPANAITSPMNLANRDRFVILSDERFTLSPRGDQIKLLDGYRKINQISTYSNSSAVPMTGSLFSLFVSPFSVAANIPTVYGDFRLRYMDN